uniref:GP4 protein n=1 Tax=Free State vervet virus TaxID=1737586 RepID=A0A159D6Y4_9NIDO|nr:GP4 protein [Free State vervet virus]
MVWLQVLLLAAFTTRICTGNATTTPPGHTGGRGSNQWHHVCVPCSAETLHNVSELSFARNESVFSGGCATHIYAGTSKFSETALFNTDAFSVLHLLECITEALATNGTFFCHKNETKEIVACDENQYTVIAFCHNTTSVVEHPAPLAAISWAAALYTAITLAGIFTLNYVY